MAQEPDPAASFETASRALSLATLAMGSLVLLGWTLDLPVLQNLGLGRATVKANTGIGLLLASITLLLLPRTGASRQLGLTCALLLTAGGALTLSQDVLGWELGLDQILFADHRTVPPFRPGRMAPTTALTFLALGIGLLACLLRWPLLVHQTSCVLSSLISGLAFLAYVLDLGALQPVAPYASMAWPTAGGLLALSLALLFSRPREGLMAVLSATGPGGMAARRTLPAVVLVPGVFGLLSWGGVERHAYGPEFAMAFAVFLSSVTLSAATWWNARSLERLDLERRRAEASTQEAERQVHLQATALNAAANAVGIADRNGRIVWVNPAFSRLTGYSAEEAVGHTFRLLRSGVHDQPFYEGLWNTILAGQVWQGEVVNRRKDGRLYHEQAAITPVRDPAGTITHFVAVKEDISARKQAEEALRQSEERLRQAQKREAIARLAGGVAHHFNNLLAAVLGRISLAQEGLAHGSRAREHLDRAVEAGDRAADLARQMLAYSGRGHFQLRPVNLSKVVEESLTLLAAAVPSQTRLETALAPDLPAVRADLGQMQQLLMNLTINGAEAIGPKVGTVRLATARLQLDAESDRYTQHTQEALSPGAYVCLEVADDGEGMDQPTLERIFDPFFSTKFVGRGLGLAAVLGIVRGHRGGIEVASVPGQGATFRVVLPATEGA